MFLKARNASPDAAALRVLLVSPLPPPNGGIGRWAVLLRAWLAEREAVELCVVDTSPRWRAVSDVAIWKRVIGGSMQGLRDAWRLLVGILRFRPHVVHITTSARLRGPWDTCVLVVSALMGVQSVYHIHMGRLPDIMRDKTWEWKGMRWALRLADRVIVLDSASEESLKNWLSAERVVRLPNAIAVSRSSDDRRERVNETGRVLYLGHIMPAKGIRELMEAWRGLSPLGWSLRLVGLVGADYQAEMRRVVGAGADVRFIGDLPFELAWQEMTSADVFVLPSHTEGFPNVILEAMAAGKAIVSTRVGGVADMLAADSQEPCGLVVVPRDAKALGTALRSVITDSELRHALGRRAYLRVSEQYSADKIFHSLVGIWRELARTTGDTPAEHKDVNDT